MVPRAAAILGAPWSPVNVMLRKSIWSSRTAHPEHARRGSDLSPGLSGCFSFPSSSRDSPCILC
jgi:hypothetical protein